MLARRRLPEGAPRRAPRARARRGGRGRLDPRRRWVAAIAVLGLVGAARSRADEGEERRAPPPVERSTPPVVVEAVRPAPLPEDPSSFTEVIDASETKGEARDVEDLLGAAVGVQVRRFGGPGQASEISIRGSTGSQVVVLLDGVRLNSAQSGTVDLSTIPKDLIERIEVSRGGGSVGVGSDAVGGVVNVVTRSASAKPRTTLRASRASFDTWAASLSQTGRLGDLEVVAGYDVFKTSGDWKFQPTDRVVGGVPFPEDDTVSIERINNRTENHAGLLGLARDLGDHVRIELRDQLFHGEAGQPGPDDTRGLLRGQSATAVRRRTRNVAQAKLRVFDLGPFELGGSLQLYHRFDRSRYREPAPPDPVDSDDRNTSRGLRLDASGEASWLGVTHTPRAGLEVRRDALDAKGRPDRERDVVGVFLQDELAVFGDRLRLVPGVRYDRTGGFDPEWIPRLGLVLEPWPWLRFQGNAERSYRAPNFDELYFDEGFVRGNPELRPEDAVNLDLGAQVGFARLGPFRDVSVEAVGFRNDIRNSIVFQPISRSVIAATNIADARVEGVELSGRLGLFGWLRGNVNWTWLDTRVAGNGGPLPGRPDHELTGRLEIGPSSGLFRLAGEATYTGDIPVVEGGALTVSRRTTLDVSGAVDLAQLPGIGRWLPAEEVLLSVTATNVTDQSVRDAQFFPQPGRVLTFQIEARR